MMKTECASSPDLPLTMVDKVWYIELQVCPSGVRQFRGTNVFLEEYLKYFPFMKVLFRPAMIPHFVFYDQNGVELFKINTAECSHKRILSIVKVFEDRLNLIESQQRNVTIAVPQPRPVSLNPWARRSL